MNFWYLPTKVVNFRIRKKKFLISSNFVILCGFLFNYMNKGMAGLYINFMLANFIIIRKIGVEFRQKRWNAECWGTTFWAKSTCPWFLFSLVAVINFGSWWVEKSTDKKVPLVSRHTYHTLLVVTYGVGYPIIGS